MSSEPGASSALDGLVVLDLTHVVAGPYATMMLGDMGAEVIKLEPPRGDTVRRSPPFDDDGMSSSFRLMNRNKKSLTLDLSGDAGQAAIRQIVPQVDVIVENFRPGGLASITPQCTT